MLHSKIHYSDKGPTVILVIGVNGVGKTTTIGKMAYKLNNDGKKVMLVAGDTFRAGAIEQIEEWGKTSGVKVVSSTSKDPSSVVFDGLDMAIEEDYDVVFIDTAGRLQNKTNLMNELAKINKIIKRKIPDAPHETLLIIDRASLLRPRIWIFPSGTSCRKRIWK